MHWSVLVSRRLAAWSGRRSRRWRSTRTAVPRSRTRTTRRSTHRRAASSATRPGTTQVRQQYIFLAVHRAHCNTFTSIHTELCMPPCLLPPCTCTSRSSSGDSRPLWVMVSIIQLGTGELCSEPQRNALVCTRIFVCISGPAARGGQSGGQSWRGGRGGGAGLQALLIALLMNINELRSGLFAKARAHASVKTVGHY